MKSHRFKLYITGRSPKSERAIVNLRRLCESHLKDRYELIIIDVLETPELAEQEKIMATPTVIKELPLPTRRIIGDLTDENKVMMGLDLCYYSSTREVKS